MTATIVPRGALPVANTIPPVSSATLHALGSITVWSFTADRILTAEIVFGGLNRNVPQEELNLLYLASRGVDRKRGTKEPLNAAAIARVREGSRPRPATATGFCLSLPFRRASGTFPSLVTRDWDWRCAAKRWFPNKDCCDRDFQFPDCHSPSKSTVTALTGLNGYRDQEIALSVVTNALASGGMADTVVVRQNSGGP